MSLEQAEESTRIRARLLEALENDDYERLPDPGYVKGYVSSYAKYLELDPAEMLTLYRRQAGAPSMHSISPVEPVVPTRKEAETLPWKTAVIAAGAIALAALAVWLVASWIGGSDAEPAIPPIPTEESTPTTSPPEGEPSLTPTLPAEGQPETAPAEQAPSEPFALTVRVSEDGRSWLRITVDGDVLFEDILGGGEEREYEVKDVAEVRVGAPGSVVVLKDGEPVKPTSDPSDDVQQYEIDSDTPAATQ